MNPFKSLIDRFRAIKRSLTNWREFGSFTSIFFPFGRNMYKSDLVRSCIRALADHTSKANPVCKDKKLEMLLKMRPNPFMNGKDFLYKTRTILELKNTAFIYIQRDEKAAVRGFYPVPYSSYEGIDFNGRLFIKFTFKGNAVSDLVLPWDDLVVLRKDYNERDIAGDDNSPIIATLELINTTNQGIANSVKSTANLRGILKSTKGILAPEDIKKQKEKFVEDYMNLNNEGGIASLDSTQEFTPITMSPIVTNAATIKEFREDVYRYFGVNDAIITSDFTEAQMEAFYEARIEPFLVALGTELTRKIYSEREIAFGDGVIYESNRINYASNQTKLNMIQLVDRGILTPNELRQMFNLSPFEGGDEFIRRLDTMPTGQEADDEK